MASENSIVSREPVVSVGDNSNKRLTVNLKLKEKGPEFGAGEGNDRQTSNRNSLVHGKPQISIHGPPAPMMPNYGQSHQANPQPPARELQIQIHPSREHNLSRAEQLFEKKINPNNPNFFDNITVTRNFKEKPSAPSNPNNNSHISNSSNKNTIETRSNNSGPTVKNPPNPPHPPIQLSNPTTSSTSNPGFPKKKIELPKNFPAKRPTNPTRTQKNSFQIQTIQNRTDQVLQADTDADSNSIALSTQNLVNILGTGPSNGNESQINHRRQESQVGQLVRGVDESISDESLDAIPENGLTCFEDLLHLKRGQNQSVQRVSRQPRTLQEEVEQFQQVSFWKG